MTNIGWLTLVTITFLQNPLHIEEMSWNALCMILIGINTVYVIHWFSKCVFHPLSITKLDKIRYWNSVVPRLLYLLLVRCFNGWRPAQFARMSNVCVWCYFLLWMVDTLCSCLFVLRTLPVYGKKFIHHCLPLSNCKSAHVILNLNCLAKSSQCYKLLLPPPSLTPIGHWNLWYGSCIATCIYQCWTSEI